jgi:hypothetical protein
MAEYLDGAAYIVEPWIGPIWRWRTLPRIGRLQGFGWGRKGAMRAARIAMRARDGDEPAQT